MALIIGPDPPRQIDWETLGKPAALDGFFRRALAKDANERFASGAELIDAMSALAADSETASLETLEPLDPEKLKMIREEERALELTRRSPTFFKVSYSLRKRAWCFRNQVLAAAA